MFLSPKSRNQPTRCEADGVRHLRHRPAHRSVFMRRPPRGRVPSVLPVRDAAPRAPAPSLMRNFAAVSEMPPRLIEIVLTTSSCRPPSLFTSRASSPAEDSGAGAASGSTSARPSIGTSPRRPRRRNASISLWRAIAFSHGVKG